MSDVILHRAYRSHATVFGIWIPRISRSPYGGVTRRPRSSAIGSAPRLNLALRQRQHRRRSRPRGSSRLRHGLQGRQNRAMLWDHAYRYVGAFQIPSSTNSDFSNGLTSWTDQGNVDAT